MRVSRQIILALCVEQEYKRYLWYSKCLLIDAYETTLNPRMIEIYKFRRYVITNDYWETVTSAIY